MMEKTEGAMWGACLPAQESWVYLVTLLVAAAP